MLISKCICDALDINGRDRENILDAAYLHDIGKIRVDLALLDKPDKLTETEWETMRKHPLVGYDILKDFGIHADVLAMVLYHHENFDGTGYPLQLNGGNIPLGARIIRVADAIDAMGSDRAYRKALPFDVINEELRKCVDTQFDPDIVAKATNGLNKRIRLILAQGRV